MDTPNRKRSSSSIGTEEQRFLLDDAFDTSNGGVLLAEEQLCESVAQAGNSLGTEEQRFLFDDSFDTSDGGALLAEEQLCESVAQFQPVGELERGALQGMLDDAAVNSSIETESPRSTCIAATIQHPTASVSLVEQQLFLQMIFGGVSFHFPELSFTMARDGNSNAPILTITQKDLFNHPPLGMISRVHVTIEYKKYSVFVLLHLWSSGEVNGVDDAYRICQDMSSSSTYKFCPGIDPDHYEEEYYSKLHFHVKSVRLCHFPFTRVDSVNCKLWFKPALNLSATEKEASEVKCPPCKRLVHDLNWRKQNKEAESPSKKIKRQDPSSRARLQYMSPHSQQKRKIRAQYERTSNIRKLRKYEAIEVMLDDEQNFEMCSVLEATQSDELEKLFKEGDEHGVGSLMKTIWYTDKDRQKNDFCNDQESNRE